MSDHLCPKCNAPNRSTARFCAVCGASLLAGEAEPVSGPGSGRRSLPRTVNSTLSAGIVLEGRYRIEEELGHGGFGAVYRAWDIRLSKAVAVKENLDISSEAQRQFTREATVLANLSHPNLPRVFDHFVISDQGQYLVMDYVEGEDLLTLLERQGEIPIEPALEWMIQVTDALEYLHSQDSPVVHRDVKPSNIRITPRGKAMLVDFGLVKFSDPRKKTTSGARAITPGYAPPEQYGIGKTDIRTDIYSLGATIYRLVAGIEPPESVQRLAGEHLTPANQVNSDISSQLSKLIDRAMALEPDKRYQNAVELKGALRDSLAAQENQVSAKESIRSDKKRTIVVDRVTESLSKQVAVAPNIIPAIQPSSKGSVLPRRFGLWLGIGAAVLFVVALGALLAVLFIDGNHVPTPTGISRTQKVETQPVSVEITSTIQPPETEQARATSNVAFNLTSTAQSGLEATERALDSYLASITANKKVIFGPKSGRMLHREEDGTVKTISAGVGLRNFVVEVTFLNPFATSKNPWDYGLMFRYANSAQQYRLILYSDTSWAFVNHIGSENGKVLVEGTIPNLDISEGGSNHLQLIAIEDRGWFFVNGKLISELDLSGQYSGGIMIATGLSKGNELTGKLTEYHDFTVWSLP
jgi:serine/threonine protein kinase